MDPSSDQSLGAADASSTSQTTMTEESGQPGLYGFGILRELSSCIQSLRSDLENEKAIRKQAEKMVIASNADIVKARQKIFDLAAFNNDLREDMEGLESERLYTQDLQRRYPNLKKDHNTLKEKIEVLQSRLASSSSKAQQFEIQLSELGTVKKDNNFLRQKAETLESDTKVLILKN
jgi:chromosome segregation ATPase